MTCYLIDEFRKTFSRRFTKKEIEVQPFRDSVKMVANYRMYGTTALRRCWDREEEYKHNEHSVRENSVALHRQFTGMIKTEACLGINNLRDLDLALSPQNLEHVAQAIREDVSLVEKLTIRSNYTAVVTNSTSVLGLGKIQGSASIPVLEGLSVLLSEFGEVNALPLVIEDDS